MSDDGEQPEIPSPVDFHDPAQARVWVEQTVAERPWRPQFFNAMAGALNRHFRNDFSVAELGSGPGHLARALISRCPVRQYVAIDFSEAMHALARDHLGQYANRVNFVTADFRDPAWTDAAGSPDALVTLQAAHEVRHRCRLPGLLQQMHTVIRQGGLLLFCDHYAEPGSSKAEGLFVAREEQPMLLREAGFKRVICLRDEGGMALYSGVAA